MIASDDELTRLEEQQNLALNCDKIFKSNTYIVRFFYANIIQDSIEVAASHRVGLNTCIPEIIWQQISRDLCFYASLLVLPRLHN